MAWYLINNQANRAKCKKCKKLGNLKYERVSYLKLFCFCGKGLKD